jgi:hypothetical protein
MCCDDWRDLAGSRLVHVVALQHPVSHSVVNVNVALQVTTAAYL